MKSYVKRFFTALSGCKIHLWWRNGLPVFLLPMVAMAPSVAVRWLANEQGMRVAIEQSDPHIAQCVQGGLEVRYRIEYRICSERGGWFDRCGESTLITRKIQYDPVSESYQIITDLIDDIQPPELLLETDADEAEKKLRDFTLNSVERPVLSGVSAIHRSYLQIRARGYCQQDDQSLITQIPYHLTFGIFQFAGFDTGWISYDLWPDRG